MFTSAKEVLDYIKNEGVEFIDMERPYDDVLRRWIDQVRQNR